MYRRRGSYGPRKRYNLSRKTVRSSYRRGGYGGGFTKRVRSSVRSFAEKKRFTINLVNAEFDWDGRREILDRIPQSAGEGGRIGRIVTPYAVTARLELINGVSSTQARSTWSILLVQDTQQVAGTHAAVSDIITDVGTEVAPMGLLQSATKGRFKILRRWEGTLMHSSQTGSIRYLNFYHRFRSGIKNIRYNDDLATGIEANGLMLILISSGDPASDQCFVSGNIRLWYTDV